MNFFGPTSIEPIRSEEPKETDWFFAFAQDPNDPNEEQLSHEESFHDERSLKLDIRVSGYSW